MAQKKTAPTTPKSPKAKQPQKTRARATKGATDALTSEKVPVKRLFGRTVSSMPSRLATS